MKIYWTLNSIPELNGLDRKEKRRRFGEIYRHGRKKIGVMPWIYTILTGVVSAAAAITLDLSGVLVCGGIGALIGVAMGIFVQAPAIDHGRTWYREHYGRA
jgi:hypothetical protein